MYKLYLVAVTILVFSLSTTAQASNMNLIQGSSISLIGKISGSSSYITDGLADSGTRWSQDSVWWSGKKSYILINLGGTKNISSIGLQADSNDNYLVEYWDANSNEWKTAFTAEATKNEQNGWLSGLDLRESDINLNVNTDQLKISAISGDNMYSISEVQAYAHTPIPLTFLLLSSGLGIIACTRRKFF